MTLKRLRFYRLYPLAVLLGAAICVSGGSISRANHSAIEAVELGDEGRAGYEEYLGAGSHRAFAVAPGGAWAWVSDMPDPDVAEAEAIRTCASYTVQRCLIYDVDGQVVFDRDAWAAGWAPYTVAKEAMTRDAGTGRGQKFPDIALTGPDGKATSLSALHGRVVFLHLWGSWCAPCQFEFPELQGLYKSLKDEPGLAFVFVQSREDFARSKAWMKRGAFVMPLYDSGAGGPADRFFTLAGGGRIEDRLVAPYFPTTYVLDSHGLVLFSKFGPETHWEGYEPLLRHAAQNRPE